MLKILIFLVVLFLVLLIAYKAYRLNKSLNLKNQEMKEYAKQMEKIIAGSANLVYITWKDQKEGILFTDNPAYKSKSLADMTKVQKVQHEIQQYQEEVSSKQKDIKKLLEKERMYLEEIERLKLEYEANKKKVLDEGASLGYAGPVLREFK